MRQNGVKVQHVLPYHPALTEAEEHSEHMAKLALTKPLLDAKASQFTLEHRLTNFLILNSSTPHTVTEHSPVKLFLERY